MKIAIVSSGVAGLTAAHLLHREHQIVLYESDSRAGGHANTVEVETADRAYSIDTGFIVMNDRTYPQLTRLLDKLGVIRQSTHMSFSMREERGGLEYAGTPAGLFCQRSNLLSGSHWRMIIDLLRFNRKLSRLLADEPDSGESLSDFLRRGRFSEVFARRLIIPQVSAVWSSSHELALRFPAAYLARFLDNHGTLAVRNRPNWSTVSGGSARYVEALTAPFGDRVRVRCAVRTVSRHPDHVLVMAAGCEPEHFDQIVPPRSAGCSCAIR